MNDLQEYFGEEPPKPPRYKPPDCTDSHGEPIKRVGKAALTRVLDHAGNVTGTSPMDYAMVYCETLGVGIVRQGTQVRHSTFTLFSLAGHELELKGAKGRDEAIRRFLRLLRKGKVYSPKEKA